VSIRKTILILQLLISVWPIFFLPDSVAEEVSKEIWEEAMKRQLPVTFCQSMEFFRQCFEVNDDQCIEAVSLAARICMHKYTNRIPDVLQQPNDGAKWGNIVGQCVGENYFETMSRKYKDTPECTEMNHWK